MLDIGAYRVTTILCCHGDRCGEISMFFSQRKVRFSIHDCSAIALVFLKSILFINNLTEQTISTKF